MARKVALTTSEVLMNTVTNCYKCVTTTFTTTCIVKSVVRNIKRKIYKSAMVRYLIVKLDVSKNNKYYNFKLCRVHTCLPDLVITISVPTAENLCHSSA